MFRLVPETAALIPAQTLGAVAGATDAGAIGCVHSNWGPAPPCNHTEGPANGLLTCTEQQPSIVPRAVWHVFAAYANTSGLTIPSERNCDDCTALCSWDRATRTVHVLAGYYNGWTTHGVAQPKAAPLSRMLRVQLHGLGVPVLRPCGSTAINATVGVKVDVIPNLGSAPLAAPLPFYQVKFGLSTARANLLTIDQVLTQHVSSASRGIWR